jgi:hypothetical protein
VIKILDVTLIYLYVLIVTKYLIILLLKFSEVGCVYVVYQMFIVDSCPVMKNSIAIDIILPL